MNGIEDRHKSTSVHLQVYDGKPFLTPEDKLLNELGYNRESTYFTHTFFIHYTRKILFPRHC